MAEVQEPAFDDYFNIANKSKDFEAIKAEVQKPTFDDCFDIARRSKDYEAIKVCADKALEYGATKNQVIFLYATCAKKVEDPKVVLSCIDNIVQLGDKVTAAIVLEIKKSNFEKPYTSTREMYDQKFKEIKGQFSAMERLDYTLRR